MRADTPTYAKYKQIRRDRCRYARRVQICPDMRYERIRPEYGLGVNTLEREAQISMKKHTKDKNQKRVPKGFKTMPRKACKQVSDGIRNKKQNRILETKSQTRIMFRADSDKTPVEIRVRFLNQFLVPQMVQTSVLKCIP